MLTSYYVLLFGLLIILTITLFDRTYQVGFILSIVFGLGVGETLFGRYGRGMPHALH